MRILHVVTLISGDGAYGGPTRVAQNQAEALRALGHKVEVVASTQDLDFGVSKDGKLRLFKALNVVPRSGFAGLVAPRMLVWIIRNRKSFDAAHIHLARDLVTLPAAWILKRLGVPIFLQTHGMIDKSSNVLARPLDLVLTRPVLRRGKAVMYLTERERSDLVGLSGPGVRVVQLKNGVPTSEVVRDTESNTCKRLLFLARLQGRKRPDLFVRAVVRMKEEGFDVSGALVGPDEGEGPVVRSLIDQLGANSYIRWEGPISPDLVQTRLSNADLFVLPSEDEPYPMSVLEAMSVGLPVIVSTTCGLAPLISEGFCGSVAESGDLESLVSVIRSLLSSPEEMILSGSRGRDLARRVQGMKSVALQLEEMYQTALQ